MDKTLAEQLREMFGISSEDAEVIVGDKELKAMAQNFLKSQLIAEKVVRDSHRSVLELGILLRKNFNG